MTGHGRPYFSQKTVPESRFLEIAIGLHKTILRMSG